MDFLIYGIALLLVLGLASRISKPLQRWQCWASFAQAYKQLPPHQNIGELAARIEQLGNCFLDRAGGKFSISDKIGQPSWEWQLGGRP